MGTTIIAILKTSGIHRLALLDRAVPPSLRYAVVAWPLDKTRLDDVDRQKRMMVEIICRSPSDGHLPTADLVRTRRLVAGRVISKRGRWSADLCKRTLAFQEHNA